MQIRFTCKSAGRFSRLIIAAALCVPHGVRAAEVNFRPQPATPPALQRQGEQRDVTTEWRDYEAAIYMKARKDRIDGISYLISGTLALVGGLAGQGLTNDPLEKGVYTLFQTIGVASIGYGVFVWKLGDNDRMVYESVSAAPGLSPYDRSAVMRSYFGVKSDREKRQKFVRALTHGLIAGLNFYGATQQKNETVKNALIFLGGVNTLATISFSF